MFADGNQLTVLGYQHSTLKEPCEYFRLADKPEPRLTPPALLGLNWYTEYQLQSK